MAQSAPGGDRLGEIAGEFDAAVGDHRHAALAARLDHVEDRGELRHADAGDDAGGADRAGADADLDRIGAGIDQRLGAVGGGDIAGDRSGSSWRAGGFAAPPSMHAVRNGRARCRPPAHRRRRRTAPRRARRRPSPVPVAAAARRRPCSSLQASGKRCAFSMSLTVIEADAAISLVDDDQLLDAVLVQQALGLVAVRRSRAP